MIEIVKCFFDRGFSLSSVLNNVHVTITIVPGGHSKFSLINCLHFLTHSKFQTVALYVYIILKRKTATM